ncbi:MAG: 2-oxo-4-hydroxy-4-carboxy-5-ureidoimidazoline decarboxylase, partial [Mesorhizobium sp.]
PWIAERAYELELGPAHDSAGGLHNALCRVFRGASEAERLSVLNSHPDLAGKLAQAKRLSAESTREQASAGLDALTDKERELFSKLNAAYVTSFGFPFIIAVKGKTKAEILAEFEARSGNSHDVEFDTACKQVERISLLRLQDMLPQ